MDVAADGQRQARRGRRDQGIWQVARDALPIYLPGAAIPSNPWIPVALGSALVLAGALLRGWAILALGRYFFRTVAVTEGQQVVTSGPYALVRHPSYTGALVAFAGFGLILANWLSLGVLIVLPVAVYVRRIQVEKRVLLQVLGVAYSTYARGKARLLPGVL